MQNFSIGCPLFSRNVDEHILTDNSFLYMYSEPGSLHSKPTYKKENGTLAYAGSSATDMVANYQRSPSFRFFP